MARMRLRAFVRRLDKKVSYLETGRGSSTVAIAGLRCEYSPARKVRAKSILVFYRAGSAICDEIGEKMPTRHSEWALISIQILVPNRERNSRKSWASTSVSPSQLKAGM